MKDRFKFRLYDKEKGLMLYEDSEILRTEKVYEYEELWWANVAFPIKAISRFFDYNSEERFVLQQCTGLKDRNGKLIYEGDLLKTRFGLILKVYWREQSAMFWLETLDGVIPFTFYAKQQLDGDLMEIIGNIYENKELLEEQK